MSIQFSMRHSLTLIVLRCMLLCHQVTATNSYQSSTTFTNTRRLLFDTSGNQIDAYGSKISFFNGTYHLYGNSFSTTGVALGIKSYSSPDLVSWTYAGYLFDPTIPNPCDDIGGCGRPHIVYNENSDSYVLWANAGSSGYVIATSTLPAGPYTFVGRSTLDPQFDGLQPADFTVESFGDQAFLVFSVLNFRYPLAGSLWPPIQQTLHISQLTPDFLNVSQTSYNVTSASLDLIDQEAESPDLFIRNGTFYVVASNTCGYCNGSIALVYRSASISGPWTRQIIAGDGCMSQVEGVLPLPQSNTSNITDPSTTFLWHGTSVPGGPRTGFGGHIFQPLQFNPDGSVQDLNCASDAEFLVTFMSGAVPDPTPVNSNSSDTTAEDSSPSLAVYTPICDSSQYTLIQTWRATRTGSLRQVSVNIAAVPHAQTTPLTLVVFQFDNLTALQSPEYRWTELGNATYNATQLSYVFNTTTVDLGSGAGVDVQQGDNLGVKISGLDFVDYCHLEYDLDEGSGNTTTTTVEDTQPVLLQQGAGQNSWRGLQGTTSVVYVRAGKGLKFSTVVE